MGISFKAIAFMPISMPQSRKVALKIFMDDNDQPSEREEVKRNVPVTRFPRWPKIKQYYVHRDDDYNMEGVIEILQEDKFVTSFDVKATLTYDRFNYTEVSGDNVDEPDAVLVISSSESDSESEYESDFEDEVIEELSPPMDHAEELKEKPSIKPYAACGGVVGNNGGHLEVKGYGVFLSIPSGALQKDINIKVELVPTSISKAVSRDNEASVCHAIRCSPSGLKLDKPMTISCEHCARISPSVKTGETPVIVYSSKEPTGAIDEGKLHNLAMDIETDQHMESLGFALGFTSAEINKYADTNKKGDRTTCKGTRDMLMDWTKKEYSSHQKKKLTKALHEAGLVMLAETHLKNVDPNKALKEAQLADLASDLKNDEQMEALGQALGCNVAAVNRYVETNRRGGRTTFKGTKDMLFDWRQKVSPGEQHQRLKEALTKANLVELCETYLKDVPIPGDIQKVDRQEMREPDCRITDKTIEFETDEFRTYEVRLPTECIDGKVVGYLPFLPLTMPKSRKPVLYLAIYDNVQGRKKAICEDMETMGRTFRDIERLFIISSSIQNSLEVSCRMDKTDEDLIEALDLLDLNLGQNVLDFSLDFNGISTNESNVRVRLTHGKRRRNSIIMADLKENETRTAWGSE